MENKIDSIIQKLYDEGVEKANQESQSIVEKAQQDAEKIVADAHRKAQELVSSAEHDIANLQKKADSEMKLSARQALTSLRQEITTLLVGTVSKEMTHAAFSDKAFVQEILVSIIKKWDVATGAMDIRVLLSADEQAQFEAFVASKYKELLDKGLEIKSGDLKEGFVIEPKDGGYKIAFSEALFTSFFDQYVKSFSKKLLFDGKDA